MLNRLIDVLHRVGKPTELLQFPDGSRVLILPYGGRVLGLFTPDSEKNFLWTHTALQSAESAQSFYASAEWHNSGGDRTWLSPEADLFFPDFPDLARYWQQRELDPGCYQVVREPGRMVLVNQPTLLFSRSKRTAKLEIKKWVEPAANPLRHEPVWKDLTGVEYAGYTLHTTLAFAEGGCEDAPQAGLWSLLQMPHAGDLFVSTFRRTAPKVLMGSASADDLVASEHVTRYRMRAPGEHKIGIRAIDTAGRAGYLYSADNQSALIVRNFRVNPSGEYVDVPWRQTDDFGYAFQACNVNSVLGSFSELEYHVPAIGAGTGQTSSHDASQVWAFRGRPDQILWIALTLLSNEI